ncbi:protein of unknown function [Desulfovibrio sp. 86]|nr:protein of unknown function [Desulfovibrio sp. 86]
MTSISLPELHNVKNLYSTWEPDLRNFLEQIHFENALAAVRAATRVI